DDVEDRGRVGYVDRGPGPADELEGRLAVVGHERVDIDQRSDVTASARGIGDDEAAVGVADEHHRTAGELGEERRDVRGVHGDAAQQVRRCEDGRSEEHTSETQSLAY